MERRVAELSMVSVVWSELLDAFEFKSSGGSEDHAAFVDLETGALHFVSDALDLDEDAPDDLESSDRYLTLPDKNELGLGRELVLSFTEQHLPAELERVASYFQKRGPYARFKELIADRGVLESWYDFEKQATERALRNWCDEHDLQLVSPPTV
jgi:hypothetical protein